MKRLRLSVACEIVEEGGRNRRFQYTLAQTLLKLWLFFLPLVAARRTVVQRRFVRHVLWAASLPTEWRHEDTTIADDSPRPGDGTNVLTPWV